MMMSLICAAVLLILFLSFALPQLQLTSRQMMDLWRGPQRALNRKNLKTCLHEDDSMTSRRARIHRVCRLYAASTELQRPSLGFGMYAPTKRTKAGPNCNSARCPIFIDNAHFLAFCLIPKVASTSLKILFQDKLGVRIRGRASGRGAWDALHRAFDSQTYRLGPRTLFLHGGAYTKALFVRHPFERLVSAYVDKALRPRSEVSWFYATFWDKIPGVKAEQRSPTFAEFVNLLLSMPVRSWDSHWLPYYRLCQPCLLDYAFVGKLETASRDFPLFFSETGVDGSRFSHVHAGRHASGGATNGVNVTGATNASARDHFAQLSYNQTMGLYARYFFDFELFGYDFRDYLFS